MVNPTHLNSIAVFYGGQAAYSIGRRIQVLVGIRGS